MLKVSNKNIKYKKLKPTKSHILKTRQENYRTSSKKLQSCNLLLKSSASLERRTWEGKLFHNLVNE